MPLQPSSQPILLLLRLPIYDRCRILLGSCGCFRARFSLQRFRRLVCLEIHQFYTAKVLSTWIRFPGAL